MTQTASFSVDPNHVLAKKIGRSDVRPEALCNVKDSLRRYFAFRQNGQAEYEMAKGWFVGTGHLGGHDNIEAVA